MWRGKTGKIYLFPCTPPSSYVHCLEHVDEVMRDKWTDVPEETAHLFGGRLEGKVLGISTVSCCCFSFVLVRLGSSLIRVTLGWSHDVSWYFLYCVMIVAVFENVGVISSRANQKIQAAFMCTLWKIQNAKMSGFICITHLWISFFYHFSFRMRVFLIPRRVSHAKFLPPQAPSLKLVC